MCLVLGCPGSGCTTFLKSISNQREEFIGGSRGNHVGGVSGEVLYAGIDAEEMKRVYAGEVVYNMEGACIFELSIDDCINEHVVC